MWSACALLIAASVCAWHCFGYQNIQYTSAKEYLRASLPYDNMEYLPKAVTRISLGPPRLPLELISGDISITPLEKRYLDDHYQIHARNLGALCYHVFNFPGWKVEINKNIVPLQENPWGLIMFVVPPGESQVRIYFTKTPIRQFAENVSLAALFIFLTGALFCVSLKRGLFK